MKTAEEDALLFCKSCNLITGHRLIRKRGNRYGRAEYRCGCGKIKVPSESADGGLGSMKGHARQYISRTMDRRLIKLSPCHLVPVERMRHDYAYCPACGEEYPIDSCYK